MDKKQEASFRKKVFQWYKELQVVTLNAASALLGIIINKTFF